MHLFALTACIVYFKCTHLHYDLGLKVVYISLLGNIIGTYMKNNICLTLKELTNQHYINRVSISLDTCFSINISDMNRHNQLSPNGNFIKTQVVIFRME